MKIIVDAFGGDNSPDEIIKGCALALDDHENVEIILTGSEKKIRESAKRNSVDISRVTIADCEDVITMDDNPIDICKKKKNSSMGLGFQMLANGQADAFMSAGNSGALLSGATLMVGRIKGVKRPAFSPIMPNKEQLFMLIDGGANNECKPEMLREFAIMGSVYMNKVMKVDNPRVALANVGTENHKGDPLRQEAFALLQNAPVNFIGNVEGRDVPRNCCDVLVTDGFTGNMILKTYEGVADVLMSMMKDIFTKNLKNKLAAAAVMSDVKDLKKLVDHNQYGGAPVLGAAKPGFKVHGSAVAVTVKNAVKFTKRYVETNVIDEIARTVARLEN